VRDATTMKLISTSVFRTPYPSIDCRVPALESGLGLVDKVSRDHPFLVPRRKSLFEYQDWVIWHLRHSCPWR
jgi:hypothetical protein